MALRYLLDTNICIYIAKQKPEQLIERFRMSEMGEIAMSAITFGELMYGAEKSHHAKKARVTLEALAYLIPPLPLSINVGEHYAQIRAALEKKGKPIGNNDLWIAAHALALDVILVTNNEKEFSRVPKLRVDNWV